MATKIFADPDLGKFAWSPYRHAWKGTYRFDTKKTCALRLRGDGKPTVADLTASMPKVKRLLEHIRDKHISWGERAAKEIQSLLLEAEFDADVETDKGMDLERIDFHIVTAMNVTAFVRFSCVITGLGTTEDCWIEVEVNGRGQYKQARTGNVDF
jgi:hypothetical protein